MHFYSGQPMHFYSGVDTRIDRFTRSTMMSATSSKVIPCVLPRSSLLLQQEIFIVAPKNRRLSPASECVRDFLLDCAVEPMRPVQPR